LLDDDDFATQKVNGGNINLPSANVENDRSNKNTNYLMDVYDAYYNGTVTVTLEPDSSNSTTKNCAKFTSQPVTDAFLRIGPKSRDNVDRGAYDNNDFYLSIGRSIKANECPSTPNKLFFAIESSNSLTVDGLAWDLNATKSNTAEAFSIKGGVSGRKAHYNNYFNYQVNTTDAGYSKSEECPNWFYSQALTALYHPILRGSVDATEARVTWTFVDYYYGYKVTAVFSGKAWEQGAKLDMSKDTIETTGQAKRSSTTKSGASDNLKWIILAVCLVAVFILGIGIFVLIRWRKGKKQKKASEKKTQEEIWQQYQMSRRDE